MVKSVPLIQANKMLGHANTAITEAVYVHLVAADLRPAADAAAAMLPGPKDVPSPGRLRRLLRWLARFSPTGRT